MLNATLLRNTQSLILVLRPELTHRIMYRVHVVVSRAKVRVVSRRADVSFCD